MQTISSVSNSRSGEKRANGLRSRRKPEPQRSGVSLAEFWKRLDP